MVGSIIEHMIDDNVLYYLNWQDTLTTGLGSTIPVRDVISTSVWIIDPNSPAADMTISGQGFDPATGQTWVTVEGGTAESVYWITNTIETSGAILGTTQTPSQRFVRKIRLRVKACP